MPIEMGSFDVIIGMDWLSKYHVVIVCDKKIIRIPFGNEVLIVHGNGSNNEQGSRLNIISYTKTQKYLLKGCHVFLAHVIARKATDKSEYKRLEDEIHRHTSRSHQILQETSLSTSLTTPENLGYSLPHRTLEIQGLIFEEITVGALTSRTFSPSTASSLIMAVITISTSLVCFHFCQCISKSLAQRCLSVGGASMVGGDGKSNGGGGIWESGDDNGVSGDGFGVAVDPSVSNNSVSTEEGTCSIVRDATSVDSAGASAPPPRLRHPRRTPPTPSISIIVNQVEADPRLEYHRLMEQGTPGKLALERTLIYDALAP
nr:reverse transcriptase domain-containing protein [Tanacetum cinerariifolium]